MSTRTPVRPTKHDTHAPTVPTRVTGPAPAPRASRSWLLLSIAAVVVTGAVIAALLWLTPGADTGSELSQAEFSTVARLEEQARQEQADFATTARLEAQAAQAEQARQEQADFATTARLEAEASANAQARAEQAESARWIAQAEHYEQLRQERANAASTARLEGRADSELAR